MKLGIAERIYLVDILTGYECPLIRVGAVKKLLDMTNFTAEELDIFGIVQLPNGEIRWAVKPGIEQEVDVLYSEKQIAVAASVLSQYPKLSAKLFPLLEKFGVKIPTEE